MKTKRTVFIILILLISSGIYMNNLFAKEDEQFSNARKIMVFTQIKLRGIKDSNVLAAMQKVERHLFVPQSLQKSSYNDSPLSIEFGQTISQPFIVAYMTQELRLTPHDKVLEIGTGSGYQAAILAEIVDEVYTIEIVKELADRSSLQLKKMGYTNITVKHGDGYQGWPEHAPFDAIIVTAAPKKIPAKLIEQLKVGGRMIIPVGGFLQELYLITKNSEGVVKQELISVRFVPMVHSEKNKENNK